jgi:hypothetical protein
MRIVFVSPRRGFDLSCNLFRSIVASRLQGEREQGPTIRLQLASFCKQVIQVARVGFAARIEGVNHVSP